jgi:hypothetical protein
MRGTPRISPRTLRTRWEWWSSAQSGEAALELVGTLADGVGALVLRDPTLLDGDVVEADGFGGGDVGDGHVEVVTSVEEATPVVGEHTSSEDSRLDRNGGVVEDDGYGGGGVGDGRVEVVASVEEPAPVVGDYGLGCLLRGALLGW